MQWQTALGNDILALFFPRPPNPDDHWNLHLDLPERKQDAARNHVPKRQPAKYVDEYYAHSRILQYHLEALPHRLACGQPSSVQEVGRAATGSSERVHCVHGQTGSVDKSPDPPVSRELDVHDTGPLGLDLPRIFPSDIPHRLDVALAFEASIGGVVEPEAGAHHLDFAEALDHLSLEEKCFFLVEQPRELLDQLAERARSAVPELQVLCDSVGSQPICSRHVVEGEPLCQSMHRFRVRRG